MKLLSPRNARILGASVGYCAIGLGIAACSSSSSGGSPDGSTGGGGGGGPCTNPTLSIVFNPMYSAFISATSQHSFQIPAFVNGVSGATVQWSASDSSAARFQVDQSTGGTMITVLKSGPVTINATAGTLCGSSVLNVTPSTEDDWTTGNARYNSDAGLINPFGGMGGAMMGPPPGGFMVPSPSDPSPFEPDGGPGPACTNCHGETATMGIFRGIEHTPEQTGGFSDQELIDIVVNGIIPDGGYYDPTIIPYRFWQFFHKWRDISTPDQQKAIVVYLRSLTPKKQDGHLDFNGLMPGGNMMPPPMDDSGPPPTDDAGETDAGTTPDAAPPDSTAPTGDATTD